MSSGTNFSGTPTSGTGPDGADVSSSPDDAARRIRLYETILGNTPDLVYAFDREHRFTYANEALLAMWGTTLDDAIGKTCLQLGYEPWHAEMHSREIDQVFATGSPVRGEVPFEGTAGRRVYDYIFSPIFGEDGEVEAIAGTARDVTDRRAAEAEAARLSDRNREILESINDAVLAVGSDWRFIYVNSQGEEILGRSIEELTGKDLWEEFPSLIGIEFEKACRQVAENRVPSNVVSFFPDHGRWYDVSVFPAERGITIYFRNITDAKKAEAALHESEALLEVRSRIFETTLTSINDFAYSFNKEGKFIYSNKPLLDLLQITLDDIRGKDFFELGYPPELAAKLQGQIQHVFDTGESVRDETPFTGPDGTPGYYEYIFSPVRSSEGTVEIVAGSTRDITERKRHEAEIAESERKLRAIYDGASDYIGLLAPDGTLLDANRSSLDFAALVREEVIGRKFWETAWFAGTEGAPELVRENFEKAMRSEAVRFETQIIIPTGEQMFFEITMNPVIGDEGAVRFVVPLAHDVTQQRRAADILRRQAALIELSYEAIFVWDMDDGIVEWNTGAERLYGYNRDEAIGRSSEDLLGARPDRDALVRDRYWTGEVAHITKDARTVTIESRQQVMESEGRLLVLETDRDVTERKNAEGILERYKMLSQNSRDTIWFTNTDLKFVEVNQAATETYGYTREEFLQMSLNDIRHPDNRKLLKAQFEEALNNGVRFETVHVRKDGTEMPVDVTASSAEFGGERLVMAIVRDISGRKESETALELAEERRKLAQEAGNVGVWDWDAITNRTYWSEMMWAIYGEDPTDINPDDDYWTRHIHPSDRERVSQHMAKVLKTKAATDFQDEYRIIRPDGRVRWIEAVAKVARGTNGRPLRMYGVNLDITARKEAEERIRLSENQLRLVTNAVPALISYVDAKERFRFVNQKFTDWFGSPTEEMVGKKVRDVVGPEAYRAMRPSITEALQGEECTFESLIRFRAAGTRYVHMSFMPDIGVDGTVYGFYGLTNDLTDLKRSQDLLRSSEERIALMMDNLSDYAVFTMDKGGLVDSWNTGAQLIFGYEPEEMIGRDFEILFVPEDIERNVPEKELRNARQKGRASDERWHLRKDGTRFFASGVTTPLFVGNELSGYAKIATDLTERQRRAEELQRAHDVLEERVKDRTRELAESNLALIQEMETREAAEKQRVDLLGRLVTSQEQERRRIARDLHDQLGQRLTALRLKIASLREIAGEDNEIASRVQRLQEIGERLDSEVSFLAWELRPSALDDLGLVDAVGAFVTEWSRHYDIGADFYSAGLASTQMSRDTETHLYRIAQEALNNIVKHAGASHVTVMLERRGSEAILIIEDDGKGFPAGDLKHGESTGGLGLIGMRERALLVGGDVEIESKVGLGTTIYVRVPVNE